MTKDKGIGGAEELDPGVPDRLLRTDGVGGGGCRLFGIRQGQGDDEEDIVAGVHLHDLIGFDRPIHPLYFPTWVLYHQCCCIHCLAVSHLFLPLSLSRKTGKLRKMRRREIEGM